VELFKGKKRGFLEETGRDCRKSLTNIYPNLENVSFFPYDVSMYSRRRRGYGNGHGRGNDTERARPA
jgi:hypothetical protein